MADGSKDIPATDFKGETTEMILKLDITQATDHRYVDSIQSDAEFFYYPDRGTFPKYIVLSLSKSLHKRV